MYKFSQLTKTSKGRFALKATTVGVMLAGLLGCQSVAQMQPVPLAKQNTTPAVHAKQTLLNAFKLLPNEDGYWVSRTQYRATPLTEHIASIDRDSDWLWQSALKTYLYRLGGVGQASQATPSGSQRFDEFYEDKDLPYVRYYDEVAGTLPDPVLTRSEALAGYTSFVDMESLINARRECANITYDIDDFVKQNPTATLKDEDVKRLMAQFDDCIKDLQTQSAPVIAQAVGYDKQDLLDNQQCVINYQRDLKDALASKRAVASYADDNYDLYLATAGNYIGCSEKLANARDLDPDDYHVLLHEESTDLYLHRYQCAKAAQDARSALIASGKTLANDPSAHLQSYFQFAACLENEATVPTSVDEAGDLIDRHYKMGDYTESPLDETPEGPIAQALSWYDSYKQMRASESSGVEGSVDIYPIVEKAFTRLSDAQVRLQDAYLYQPMTVDTLMKFSTKDRRADILWSVKSDAPTMGYGVKLPLRIDANNSSATADISAVLPLLATSSKLALLAKEGGLVEFHLPETIKNAIPTALIYDSIERGVLQAFESMHDEAFTPVDIRADEYAQQIGAARAVKLQGGMKTSGIVVGTIAKIVVADMKAYIDAHPQFYTTEQAQKIKTAIDEWAVIDKGFRTDDVGNLLAAIEAVLPIAIDGAGYFYFDNKGTLIGIQQHHTMDNALENVRTETLTRTQLNKRAFEAHPLAQEFADAFVGTPIDGNARFTQMKQDEALQALAADARDGYRDVDLADVDAPSAEQAEKQTQLADTDNAAQE